MKKKLIVLPLLMIFLLALPFASLAETADPLEPLPYYLSFTGTITEISERVNPDGSPMDGSKFVLLENEEGDLMNFVVGDSTYLVTGNQLETGIKATGYYASNKPALLIYPPQQQAEILILGELENGSVQVGRFDSELVSDDNNLKIISTEGTQILDHQGNAYTGELKNKNLIVYYEIATFSIPAQTTPTKIVVLPEDEFENNETSAIEEPETERQDLSQLELVVENVIQKDAPKAYYNQDGYVMVPLRAILEGLDQEFEWEHETKTIQIGITMSLSVGNDYYTYARTAPIQLGAAPELKDGLTYVPLSFFKDVARMNNAYIFENQIVIDNNEAME